MSLVISKTFILDGSVNNFSPFCILAPLYAALIYFVFIFIWFHFIFTLSWCLILHKLYECRYFYCLSYPGSMKTGGIKHLAVWGNSNSPFCSDESMPGDCENLAPKPCYHRWKWNEKSSNLNWNNAANFNERRNVALYSGMKNRCLNCNELLNVWHNKNWIKVSHTASILRFNLNLFHRPDV